MSLDQRYVLAPSLQEYFVDKDTGLPLAAGEVYFYQNDQRNVPKTVFELSQVGGDYVYTPLPNPITLSAVGTFQDASGNDILPYYFPYDEVTGLIELYYIEVYSSGGILQFTRIAWPNFIDNDILADQDVTNFVANGQFVLHNDEEGDTPLSGSQVQTTTAYAGTIGTLNVWEIAQGGWTFEKNTGSTSVDEITFPRFASSTETPTGNPRFSCQIATTVAGSDTAKDLCLKFPNVNTFSSDNQEYNLYFEAQSTGGNISNVQILTRKFFGTGGSAAVETEITTITLQNSWQKYNTTILFGTNENQTLGTGDDDFIQIVIRLPVTGVQTAQFVNFCLTINDSTLATYPSQTYAEQYDQSTTGWLSTPVPSDGSAFYLPIVYTPTGTAFDDSFIGRIFCSPFSTAASTELICDGTSYYGGDYSSIGIPYSRLANKYFNASTKHQLFGTGYQFIETYAGTTNTALNFLQQNVYGANTFPADAGPAPQKTGFTFTNVSTGIANPSQRAFMLAASTILVRTGALFSGFAAPTAGNSGFSVSISRNSVSSSLIYSIQTTAAAAITAGHYYTFATNIGNYYVWFKVNGAGADPAPGGTGIEVDILSTWSAAEVAQVLFSVMNGAQTSTITFVGSALIPPGAYFTFSTSLDANDYYVWYSVNNVGTDPAIANRTGIQVSVGANDTAATVADATLSALNKSHVGTADLRGLFIRGYDNTSYWDQESGSRFGTIAGVFGNSYGTVEIDNILSHAHTVPQSSAAGAPGTPLSAQGSNPAVSTSAVGGSESRPYNQVMTWVTRY